MIDFSIMVFTTAHNVRSTEDWISTQFILFVTRCLSNGIKLGLIFICRQTKQSDISNNVELKDRILCFVITSPKTLYTKAVHVRDTWGKKCNKIIFFSSKHDKVSSKYLSKTKYTLIFIFFFDLKLLYFKKKVALNSYYIN